MRKTKFIRFGSLFILCLLLIAFTVCSLTGCKDGPKTPAETSGQTQTPVELGSGEKTITFEVQFADGSMHVYKIHTDKTILADALLEHNLVSGTTESYGLYVKTVDGELADYDVDQSYWSLYIGGEYAMTGVSSTEIQDGQTYKFAHEKYSG